MKTNQEFLTKSKESFPFIETDCLIKYKMALIDEMINPLYEAKQKRYFMAEIQKIEKFVKTIHKYS